MSHPLLTKLYGGNAWILPGASLDLDFVNQRYYQQGAASIASILTCTRASVGYIDDLSGNWTQVAANTLRISTKGLLVEQSATNGIRNNSMQGAVVGVVGSGGSLPTNWIAPGGCTVTVVGTGTSKGIDYIDINYSGTASAANFTLPLESAGQIAATIGQVCNESVFAAIVGGDLTNISAVQMRISERDASNAQLQFDAGTDFKASLTATLQRFQQQFTTSNASCASVVPYVWLQTTIGASVNITIRWGWPQLELSPFATSPIRTTSAAATRTADVVSVNNVPANLATSGFALYSAWTPYPPSLVTTTNRTLLSLSDGTNNNRGEQFENIQDKALIVFAAGGTSIFNSSFGAALTTNATHKMAHAWQSGDFAAVVDGGSAQTSTTAGTMGAALSQLYIGSHLGLNSFAYSYITRVALWASRIPNATLTQITT
jgi:hypothetical protein